MKKEIIKTTNGNCAIYMTEEKNLPQLFCIHGGMGLCSDSLFSGLSPLSQLFDLIFIDLRGCGLSDKSANDSYLLTDFAEDIIEIIKNKKKNHAIGLFGHSLGGMITIQTIAQNPNIFSFAILANTAQNDTWREYSQKAVENIMNPGLEKALENYQLAPDTALTELAIEYGPIYFPELSFDSAKKQMGQFSYRNDAMNFTGTYVYPNMNLSAIVKSIQIPILIIGGTNDQVVPPFCQEELQKTLLNGTLSLISGTGHFPFITAKDIFYNNVSQWWETIQEDIK
jgi:proline iminopeptidase